MTNTNPSARTTILLTGASGVIGQALLPRLHDFNVLCLVHRTPVRASNVVNIAGDIAQPRFGLDPAMYKALAGRIDGIVHSAAMTKFSQPDEVIFQTNVDGTWHVVELADQARVPLFHISTAFVHATRHADTVFEPTSYERSKRAAEHLVQTSGLQTTIIRPSVVVGDSHSGSIASFQGLHGILGLVLRGLLPVIPALPHSYVDFVPQDFVAEVIVRLLKCEGAARDYWITAGSRAMTVGALIELCVEHGQHVTGRPIALPRLVTPDLFERLIQPVFLPALPGRLQRTVRQALQMSKYLSIVEPLPSSFDDAELCRELPPLPPLEPVFLRNLEYWLAANRNARTPVVPERPAAVASLEVQPYG